MPTLMRCSEGGCYLSRPCLGVHFIRLPKSGSLYLFSTSLSQLLSVSSKNAGPCFLTVSNLCHLRFIPLKSRAVNLPACFNRWVRRQDLAGDWSWLRPCSVHLHRPQLIDSWAAIHWTHTICCQPHPDPTHSREQKSSACLNKLFLSLTWVQVVVCTSKKRRRNKETYLSSNRMMRTAGEKREVRLQMQIAERVSYKSAADS